MEGGNEADNNMVNEAAPPPPEHPIPAAMAMELSPCGRFIQYKVIGGIFEVTSKYQPPITVFGQGSHGFVCSALNSETNEHVAIKKISMPFDTKVDATRTLREIKLLRYMDHENVVAIKDIIPPKNMETFTDVYIAYGLMDTDLRQVIYSEQPLSEAHCQYLLYQILCGLKYIHSANVMHGDLRPNNLLLNANCDLKICNFGLARVISESNCLTEYAVSRWYRAPELLLSATDIHSKAVDVWAVGCIFMEMMNRRVLLPGRNQIRQIHLVLELLGKPSEAEMELLSEETKRYLRTLRLQPCQPFTARLSQKHPLAADLIEKMLSFDPRRRITVDDALAHPYLASLHDISNEPVCMAPFSFDFEQHELTGAQIKEMIYQEALSFNPEYNEHM